MTKIFCFANHKGGTGKSTSTLNIGAGLANLGKKVLLIDLDPQANLTAMLGFYERPKNTIYEIFARESSINDCIIELKSTLHLLPSALDLSGTELEIANYNNRNGLLKDFIETLNRKYDFILIDAPPSMSLLTINGLVASQKVFIPVQTEFIALKGLTQFINIITQVKSLNSLLVIGGIIATRFDNRKILNRSVVEHIKETYQKLLLPTYIRENISIAESVANGQDIFSYAPKSNGAKDYSSLVNNIIKLKG